MESPIYVLASQQDALDRQMQVVANNVANVNTSGYKTRGVLFEDYLKQPDPKAQGHHMVLDRGSFRNTNQGAMVKTDNPLDVAISGKGYFAVQTPQGIQYTRAGSFQIDTEGNLVTNDGYRVMSGGGQAIAIPENARQIAIGRDGTISTDVGDVGQLQAVTFDDENAMEQTYGGFYTTDQAPQVSTEAAMMQGMVESSNVRPVEEMARVIEITRTYQRVSRLIEGENERLRGAIRTLGRVA